MDFLIVACWECHGRMEAKLTDVVGGAGRENDRGVGQGVDCLRVELVGGGVEKLGQWEGKDGEGEDGEENEERDEGKREGGSHDGCVERRRRGWGG